MTKKNTKLTHRLLPLLLVICLLVQIAPPVTAAALGLPGKVTVGSAAELPTEIAKGTTVELTADITLTEGQQIKLLAGVLDGKGHTITVAGKALAAEVTGTIQNLGIQSSKPVTGAQFGPTFGSITDLLNGGTILNSFSLADVKDSFNDAGGLVGESIGGTIRNCFHGGTISGMMAGGLIGKTITEASPSTVTECYYTGGEGPVSMGTHYNKDEGRFAKKTQDEMKTPEFAELLNKNIQDTGYTWAAVPGSFPKLVAGDGGGENPDQPTLNTEALEAAITAAKAVSRNDYTTESWARLQTALQNAEAALKKTDLTQQEADAAAAALQAAIRKLEKLLPTQPVELPARGVIELTDMTALRAKFDPSETKDKFYRLMNDVVLPSDWFSMVFAGVLDGNGHTVTITGAQPLFEDVTETGILQNVNFVRGTPAGGSKMEDPAGPVAANLKGCILNCRSAFTGKSTGFVDSVKGGVIANCISVGLPQNGAFAAKYTSGILQNCYWPDRISNNLPAAAMKDCAALSDRQMKTTETRDLLNNKRGAFGAVWGQGSDGYPYFGENMPYVPEGEFEAVYPVIFEKNGLETPIAIGKNNKLTLNPNDGREQGFFKLLNVPSTSTVSWSCDDSDNNNTMAINLATGEYFVFGAGTAVVRATEHTQDGSSRMVAEIVVTSAYREIKEVHLFAGQKEVTNGVHTVAGSAVDRITVKVLYESDTELTPVSKGCLFTTDQVETMILQQSDSGAFSFSKPGTARMTVSIGGLQAFVDITSTYVPVESIVPSVSGRNELHGKNSMYYDYNTLETQVIILPENASYKLGYTVTSSNPDVAVFSSNLPLGYIPKRAGDVTFTASITNIDPVTGEKTVITGSSDVTFYYKNPLKKIEGPTETIQLVAYNAPVKLDLRFFGAAATPEGYSNPYAVTETRLIWTFIGDGEVEITYPNKVMQIRGTEYPDGGEWVSNTEYFVQGVGAGKVTAIGIPVDDTADAAPVRITFEVLPGKAPDAFDIPGFIRDGMDTALTVVQNSLTYQYGDEWEIYGLLRAGISLPQDKLDSYYNDIAATVQGWKANQKPTDIERVALTLAIMGRDITDVGGVNLAAMIYNHTMLKIGSNEVAWGLIALDALGTEIPADARHSRESMLQLLLTFQNADGGFALNAGGSSGADTTAMALQALAPYGKQPAMAEAVEKGLAYLKTIHNKQSHFDAGNCEATAQTIITLAVLGKDLAKEPGFFSSRYNLMTALNTYFVRGEGFRHTADMPKVNDMATIQALQALDAYNRLLNGKSGYWEIAEKTPDAGNSDADQKAADAVIDLIQKLPRNITLADKAAVQAARTAYGKLTAAQKKLVTNISVLEKAEKAIADLEKPLDQKAADSVTALIAKLPEASQVSKSHRDAITAARAAYDRLTAAQKKLVRNYGRLTAAERALSDLDKGKIGSVVFSAERFTIGQGFLTEPVIVPIYKGDTYADVILRVLGDKASIRDNNNYLQAIMGADKGPRYVKIPEYITRLSGNRCTTDSVREFYNEMGRDTWGAGNLGEFTYGGQSGWIYHVNGQALSTGIGETEAVNGAVVRLQYTVYGLGADLLEGGVTKKDDLIRAMAQVNAEPDSVRNSAAVRAAYARALTAVQNMTLSAAQVEAAAANVVSALAEAKDVAAQDQQAARKVMDLINAIGKVTENSGSKIAAARKAYDSLTDVQKALISNYGKLTAAEAAFAESHATDADRQAAKKVMDLISAIGRVTPESAPLIAEARKAYDSLTGLQKTLVENYGVLLTAERRLDQLTGPAHKDIFRVAGDLLSTMANRYTPEVGSVGGEWIIIGLLRSGREIPSDYYDNVVKYVRANINDKQQLHRAKSSDNSRVILALGAMGADVTNVDGHNLLMGLTDMKYVERQGINGPIWALIALNSGNYEIPNNPNAKVPVTREGLLQTILDAQLSDGGWDLGGRKGDADMTGMALQALAPYYKTDARVKQAVDKALVLLSSMQNDDGTFGSIDGASSESSTQVIVALTALGIDPHRDSRFIKNGMSAVDGLCKFAVDEGFEHTLGGGRDQMATEQGYYALTAYFRMLEGKTSLYDMTDVLASEVPQPQIPETEPADPQATQPQENQPDTQTSGSGSAIVYITVAAVVILLAGAAYVIYRKKKASK